MIDTDKYEPTTIDWVLHKTRGHTPTENWNGQGTPVGFNITWHDTDQRWDEEEAHMAECNQWLVRNAPLLREEVIRLSKENERLIKAVKEDNAVLKKHIEVLEEVKRLREAIADIANNMQAADPSLLRSFIRDLLEVIE